MTYAPAVTFESVTKTYPGPHGPLVAVDDVSLSLDTGGIVSLLGPNGAGKTTTIEMISGLRRPSHGLVRTLGLDPVGERDALRRRLTVQPQKAALFEHQTVAELLKCWTSFYSGQSTLTGVAEMLGLDECLDRRVGRLSGGQQQRVLVALALVADPELLVLDEPSTGLDPNARADLWRAITPRREDGKTVLLSTHSMEEAEQLADRVVILYSGRVVADGTPAQLISRYAPYRELAFDVDSSAGRPWSSVLESEASVRETRLPDGWVRVRLVTQRTDEVIRDLATTPIRRIEIRDGGLSDVFRQVTGAEVSADGAVTSGDPPERGAPRSELVSAGPGHHDSQER